MHLFRHTMQLLMLENVWTIRYIQAMLGHRPARRQPNYTQVLHQENCNQNHADTHPADPNPKPTKKPSASTAINDA